MVESLPAPLPVPEPRSVDCRQALERAGALLAVEGSAALRAQAQQQAALELLQARKLGAADGDLAEVLLRRIHAAVTELVGTGPPSVAPRAMAESQPALTLSPDPARIRRPHRPSPHRCWSGRKPWWRTSRRRPPSAS